jgi:hypothetical protein
LTLKQNQQCLALHHLVFAFPCNVFPLVELTFENSLQLTIHSIARDEHQCSVDTFARPLR